MPKPKLAVAIPVHCAWPFAELTIASFLKTHREHFDINLHVGVHSNYADYTGDLRLFDDLAGVAQVHLVDEIDWGVYDKVIYRYSIMHAKNLENILKQIRHYTFDYVAILDHDLFVTEPFVKKALDLSSADLIGCAFDDDVVGKAFTNKHDQRWFAAPKISVWHLLLSRKLYDLVMADPRVIYPALLEGMSGSAYGATEDVPVFVDTFAEVFHRARKIWPVKVQVLPSSWYGGVQHFYGSSFNYGQRMRGAGLGQLEEDVKKIFEEHFKEGLSSHKTCL